MGAGAKWVKSLWIGDELELKCFSIKTCCGSVGFPVGIFSSALSVGKEYPEIPVVLRASPTFSPAGEVRKCQYFIG